MVQRIYHFSKSFFRTVLDLVLPPRCPIIGELVGQQGTLHPSYWATLNFIQSPFCTTCGQPFPNDVEDGTECGACVKAPPIYHRARHVWRYDDASSAMILKFKHADALHLAPVLGGFLGTAGHGILLDADLLVPVPLHRWRLLKRRYNQAGLLARIISAQHSIPVASHLLRRIRATESQGHKNATERRNNIHNAFTVDEKQQSSVVGKNVVLIDDVYTSGATIHECTETLLAAGAARIDVLCLARVCHNH